MKEQKMRFKNYLTEGSKTLNVAKVSLDKARAYAEKIFGSKEELNEVIPNFDRNYKRLQDLYKKEALGVSRIKMPVIEPKDMKKFDDRLSKGQIDIFRPFTLGKAKFPINIDKKEGEKWVKLGEKDGNKDDDKVPAKLAWMSGAKLKPIQNQLWLEKLIGNIKKHGAPKPGSPVLETTIIVSKEGYILDGHHRHGQIMLVNPSLKMKALHIPLDIDTLLKMGRSYGAAIGNKPKA
jgi:hypothetical protein